MKNHERDVKNVLMNKKYKEGMKKIKDQAFSVVQTDGLPAKMEESIADIDLNYLYRKYLNRDQSRSEKAQLSSKKDDKKMSPDSYFKRICLEAELSNLTKRDR